LRCGFGTVTAPAVSTAGASLFFRAGPGAVAEAAALTRLAEGDTPHVPTCVAADVNDDFAWVLETNVPGRPTARLTQELVRGAATFLAGLPRVSQPSSWSADVDTVQHVAPQHERALEAVRAQLTRASADLPGVGRHGDFWAGNLLTRAGRLSGVVDWDAWQPSGFPGTDLLHLIATRERHARRVSLGAVFLHEPWSDDEYERSAEAYWRALDVHPTRPVLTAVGIAWWLGQVAGDLRRSPAFATDPMWMHTNVDAVVASRVLSG
jgi:hypothetical protein